MSEAKKRRRQAVAAGIVGLASLMGVAATALVMGVAIGGAGGAGTAQSTEAGAGAGAADGSIDWAAVATAAMGAGGHAFGSADFDGGVLTVSGDAPSAERRGRAFEAGRDAVLDNPAHAGQVLAFVNAITVDGRAVDSAPDAASVLGDAPQAEACQTAYNTLLDGRTINFDSGSAVIAASSNGLLDALAAVAARCGGYRVEIGGHTDALGDDGANQALSERRAQSVADYLVVQGVMANQLTVVGYGETRPKDAAGTQEADAANRRIEFKVEERPQ
jgi:outer membrane protein OmpA-like peptidoglycan-associated protein